MRISWPPANNGFAHVRLKMLKIKKETGMDLLILLTNRWKWRRQRASICSFRLKMFKSKEGNEHRSAHFAWKSLKIKRATNMLWKSAKIHCLPALHRGFVQRPHIQNVAKKFRSEKSQNSRVPEIFKRPKTPPRRAWKFYGAVLKFFGAPLKFLSAPEIFYPPWNEVFYFYVSL